MARTTVSAAALISVSGSPVFAVSAANSSSASAFFIPVASVAIRVIDISKSRDVITQADERVDNRRVVHRASATLDNLQGGGNGHLAPIRTIGGQRIEAVDDRHDAGAKRNPPARKPPQVTRSVPVLMVRADNRYHPSIDRKLFQHGGADIDMPLDLLELVSRQASPLVEDVARYRDLADVVHQRGLCDCVDQRYLADSQRGGEAYRVLIDATTVSIERRIGARRRGQHGWHRRYPPMTGGIRLPQSVVNSNNSFRVVKTRRSTTAPSTSMRAVPRSKGVQRPLAAPSTTHRTSLPLRLSTHSVIADTSFESPVAFMAISLSE